MDLSSTPAPHGATDPGFPASPAAELLAQNTDLIARLKTCYGADSETFAHEILRVVERYAAFVHLLPATADNFFNAPGGLFRLGLETGFFALQGTDGHILHGQATISARRQLEPRWRLATFIAGLCAESHRVFSHMRVADAAGRPWPGYLGPLADWLAASGAHRYYLRWRPRAVECRPLGVFALPHIVPATLMQHLAADNEVVVPQLMASVAGLASYRDHNVLDDLVRRSLALVVDRHLSARADRYGRPQFGSHLERYLVDALRRLAATDPGWEPNQEKSRLWFARDGMFLLWPAAAHAICRVLEGDQLPGIPKSPETLLEVLLAAGVVTARDAADLCWPIQPPGAKAPLQAVRLATPAILFNSLEPLPAPLPGDLVVDSDTTGPHTHQPSHQPAHQPSHQPAPQPAPPPPGTQLPLLPAADAPPLQPAEHSHPVEPDIGRDAPLPEPPRLALKAPMRLNPLVRSALEGIVATLNVGAGPPQCCTVADGLFVPLDQLERRGVSAASAIRALSELGLLAAANPPAKGPPTRSRDFGGTATVGVVIRPDVVEGFDPRAFALAPPPEE